MRSSSADPAELRRFGLDEQAGIGGVRASSWAVEDGLARYRVGCPDHPLADADALLWALRDWAWRAEETAAWVLEVALGFHLADLAAGTVRPSSLVEAVFVFEVHRGAYDTARDTVAATDASHPDGFVSLEDLWAVYSSGLYPPALAEAARWLLILARDDELVEAAFTPRSTPSAWDRFGGWVHLSLDLAGMAPVAGDVADLVNAGIYSVEHKWTDVLISLGAALAVGQAASTSRVVRSVARLRHRATGPPTARAVREAVIGAVTVGQAYSVVDGTIEGDWKRVLGNGLPAGRSLRHPVVRAAAMTGSARLAAEVAVNPVALPERRRQPALGARRR
jgi:hypothetical protein